MVDTPQIPSFIIEDEMVPETQLRYTEQSIRDNPEAFRRALERLGEVATAGTLALDAIDTELTTLEQGASGVLTKFFSKRYDIAVSFDDDTEDALAADPDHRALLAQHLKTKNIRSKSGVMKTEILTNPDAEPARDAVRRSRIGFFITRTIAYQAAQKSEAELSSAS